MRVLVDDGIFDNRSRTDTDIGDSELPVVLLILFILIIVCAHHQCSFEYDVLSNDASYPRYGIHDLRTLQDRAFRQNRFTNFAAFHSGGRQESWTREYRRDHIMEIEMRSAARQIDIGTIKRFDGAKVLPVSVK